MPIANGIIRFNKHVINPLTLKLAGRGPMVDLEHGRMHIGGEILTLGPPRTVEPAAGRSRIPQPQRTLLRWPIRCRDYVELPVIASARAASTVSG